MEPWPIVERFPHDSTLIIKNPDTRSEADAVSVVQLNSRLLDFSFFPTRQPLLIEVCSALIVVTLIGLLRPIRDGARRLPFVATLLLADSCGCVLVIFDSNFKDGVALPFAVVNYCSKRTSAAELRKFMV